MSDNRLIFQHDEREIARLTDCFILPRIGELVVIDLGYFIVTKIEHGLPRSMVTKEIVGLHSIVFLEKLTL